MRDRWPDGVPGKNPYPDAISERNWGIFCAYLNDNQSYRAIAASMNISVERVSQIVFNASRVYAGSGTGHLGSQLQRKFPQGVPAASPLPEMIVSAKHWAYVVRHVNEREPVTRIAEREGLSLSAVDNAITRAAQRYVFQREEPAFSDLPTRVINTLKHHGYERREQIEQATDDEFLEIRNLGKKGLAIIRAEFPYCPASRQQHPLIDATTEDV